MKIDDSREMMRIFESICQNDMLNEMSDVDVGGDWKDGGGMTYSSVGKNL